MINQICYFLVFLRLQFPNLSSSLLNALPQGMPHQSPPQQEQLLQQQQQQAVPSQQPPAVIGTSGTQLQYPTQQQQQQKQQQQLPPVFPNLNSMLGGFVGAQNFAAFMAAPQNAQAAWLANPALFQQQLFMNQLMQHQAAQQQQHHQQQHLHNQQQQDALSSARTTNQPEKAEPQSHANTTNTECSSSNSNHMLSAEV
jgi:hypothetical protein